MLALPLLCPRLREGDSRSITPQPSLRPDAELSLLPASLSPFSLTLGKFIISLTGFSGTTQINFPSLPLSQASQSLNAKES